MNGTQNGERQKIWRAKKNLLFMIDADAYQRHLEDQRKRGKKWRDAHVYQTKPRERNGGFYKPRPQIRVPDYCTLNGVKLDTRSPFLVENLTPEMLDYARRLFIERREQYHRRRA